MTNLENRLRLGQTSVPNDKLDGLMIEAADRIEKLESSLHQVWLGGYIELSHHKVRDAYRFHIKQAGRLINND